MDSTYRVSHTVSAIYLTPSRVSKCVVCEGFTLVVASRGSWSVGVTQFAQVTLVIGDYCVIDLS